MMDLAFIPESLSWSAVIKAYTLQNPQFSILEKCKEFK
jgi:hypothetical protein